MRRFLRHAFFITFVAATLSVVGSASAAPTPAERETARRLMDDGRTRTKNGDLTGAIDAFKKAHDIMRVPTTGYALAKAYLEHGDLVEARDAAIDAYRAPVEPREPAVFAEARQRAQEIEAKLKPRIPLLTIVAKNAAPDAELVVDDRPMPRSLLGAKAAFNPGHHTIKVTSAGALRMTDLDLAEGEEREVELAFPAELKPVDVPKKSAARGGSAIDSEGRGGSLLVPVGLGVAGIGLAVGAVTGVLALSKSSSVRESCTGNQCDPAVEGELDAARSMALVSNVSFAVAAAGGVLVVVGLLTGPKHEKRKATSFEPWIGVGGAGARGTF